MPTEVNHLPDHDSKPISTTLCWLDKMKALSHQEDELAKAVQKKIVRKNLTANKPASNQKKTCICAPTQHEGSFRCHLHRVSVESHNKSNINAKNVLDLDGKQPRLSRFGRDASTRACHDSLPLTMAEQVN
ncbi:uncharacterized protein LOC133741035 [Rosa rugosa]|uniref:uncharacterized protein LOC133741035 n=1 Tax=Rosa rugosa TaxID=74645 RepID=UPI002B40B146|nr:uncharacterized protein LOC133741035 [Rosa rugosa]